MVRLVKTAKISCLILQNFVEKKKIVAILEKIQFGMMIFFLQILSNMGTFFPSEAAVDMGLFNILFVYIPTLNFLSDPPPYFTISRARGECQNYDI